MNILSAFATVFLVCLSGCASQAPSASALAERAGADREALVARLELTDEQIAQVESIIEAANQQRMVLLRSVREEAEGRPDPAALSALRDEMSEIDQAERERLAEFLTPDQLAAYDEYREQMRADRQARRREQMRTRFRNQ